MSTVAARPAKTDRKPTLFRGRRAPVDRTKFDVQREAGTNGAGVLYGVSLIAEGEALGHQMWIDATTLEQVAELASAEEHGIKARFTHPSMSSDGMGRFLGRIQNVRVEENRVLGDLHFAQSAHDTPDGDLADYVMQLAAEDHRAAGLSIVFEHDFAAEEAFIDDNLEDFEWTDRWGDKHVSKRFKSPDENNVANFPHVRLAELNAADIVDEPAANPEGLFDRQPLAREADDLLSYAAGLLDTKPQLGSLNIDGDRAKQFLTRWLGRHGLSLLSKEGADAMSDKPDSAADVQPDANQPTRDVFVAEMNRYTEAFGAENGTAWFRDGLSFEDALQKHCEALQAANAELQEQVTEANEKLSQLSLGEDEPLGVADVKAPTRLGAALFASGASNN